MEPILEFWMDDGLLDEGELWELDELEAEDLMALGVASPCRNCSSRLSIVLHCKWAATA